jgi:hypothetical protein
VLEQAHHVVPVGMQEVRQQTVRVAADLAAHPLDQDGVVDITRARRSRVGAPADQAAHSLTVGIRTAVRDGEAATGEGNGIDVLLCRSRKVLYNDHVLGTPPRGRTAKSRDTAGVSSFLAWMDAPNKQRATSWQRAIIPVSALPVKLGCGFPLPLFCRSCNLTAQTEAMIGTDGLPILFGQDWPYFDQRKWPITVWTFTS